jgi:hypothetical protein
MEIIPSDILKQIFAFLPDWDRISIACTCHGFLSLITKTQYFSDQIIFLQRLQFRFLCTMCTHYKKEVECNLCLDLSCTKGMWCEDCGVVVRAPPKRISKGYLQPITHCIMCSSECISCGIMSMKNILLPNRRGYICSKEECRKNYAADFKVKQLVNKVVKLKAY